jgi:hypothetical protein
MATKPSTLQKVTIIRPSMFRKAISGKVLLHLTAVEWDEAIKKGKQVPKLAPEHATFEAVPLPGGDGDMLVGVKCPRGTISTMRPNPDDITIINPECLSVPGPFPKGADPPCTLRVKTVASGPASAGGTEFFCQPSGCHGNCVLEWTKQNGSYVLGCTCRT